MANPVQQPTLTSPGVSAVFSWTPSAVTKVSTIQTKTITGLGLDPLANQQVTVGNYAVAAGGGAQSQTAGISIGNAWVSAQDVISVEIYNDWAITGGSATPASGNYTLVIH